MTIEKRKALGLGKNRDANMLKAPIDIQANDIKSRNKVGDTCADCPGVVHANDWLGGVRINLWGYNSCLIIINISECARLIGYLDATVMSNFGLDKTPYRSKIQVMKFGIQPADFYMSNDAMAMMPKKFKIKLVKLSQLIETRIKAPDVELFLSALFEAFFKCTGVKVKPTMIHSDCAGQLETVIIVATRGDGQVST